MLNFTCRPLYLRAERPRHPLYRWLGGSQSASVHLGEETALQTLTFHLHSGPNEQFFSTGFPTTILQVPTTVNTRATNAAYLILHYFKTLRVFSLTQQIMKLLVNISHATITIVVGPNVFFLRRSQTPST